MEAKGTDGDAALLLAGRSGTACGGHGARTMLRRDVGVGGRLTSDDQ